MNSQPIVIKSAHLIDPVQGIDSDVDILIEEGKIAHIDQSRSIGVEGRFALQANGALVFPGLIDLHVHLREPGHEYKEDLTSGLAAAAAGGFTSVLAMPNTSPPVDNALFVRGLLGKAKDIKGARLYQAAAMTIGLKGEELTEFNDLKQAGAVAVTDDGRWVANSAVMRRVLSYAHVCDLLPLSHAQEMPLSENGQMHEGHYSTKLGLVGMPAEAESIAVFRDLSLAMLTNTPIHICHVSSALTLDVIRFFKNKGSQVTCETAPHYLFLTDQDLVGYDTNFKMNPPLRSESDLKALRDAVLDGTIDLIATDHAPHSALEKEIEFMDAAFGIIGLETALPLMAELLANDLNKLVRLMSVNPAKILKIPGGTLPEGSPADLCIFDKDFTYEYDHATSKSKSRNSPFIGRKLRALKGNKIIEEVAIKGREFKGKVLKTLVGGEIVFES
jgi:dihydroorotase